MASSGIRRKVDDLGRVVIPAGIRRTLGIREGDPVEVTVEGERVVLAKPRDACVFCGREEEALTDFRGRLVCNDCLASLGAVAERRRATTRAAARPAAPPPPASTDLPDWDGPAHRPSPAAGPAAAPRPAAPGAPTAPGAAGAAGKPMDSAPAWVGDGDQHPRRPASGVPTGADERTPSTRGAPAEEEPRERDRVERDHDERDRDERRRRPPYDPASTTAW